MTKYTAAIERGDDGSWSCYTVTPLAIGVGDTKEAAQEDLRQSLAGVLELLKEQGNPVPEPSMELVSIEVTV